MRMRSRAFLPRTSRSPKSTRVWLSRPVFPEGVSTFLLSVAIVTCAGLSVQTAEWTRVIIPIGAVALCAAVFGAILAKVSVPDSLAHLLSILTGTALSVLAVAARADTLGDGLRDRFRPIGNLVLDWYLGENVPAGTEALLVSILMGIVVWLVGYLATWTLFRRGWIVVALLLPAFLVLINLGYAPQPDTRYLAVYAALCIPLVARYHLFVKQREWSRHRLSGSPAFASRFLVIGVVVAILATGIGWWAPASLSQATFQPLVGEVSIKVLDAQEQATEWLRQTAGQPSSEGLNSAGSFSSFDNAFSVGGPLNLTDEPQALVSADDPPYLAAQRYDAYSGRGWSSSVEDTFDSEGPDGRTFAPNMTFQAGQDVILSDDVMGGRVPLTVAVTPLGPSTDRLLTVAIYLTADVDTSVRLSWTRLDNEPFSLRDESIASLPADLQWIASLLLQADLRGEPGSGGPGATDPDLQRQIEDARQQLQPLFPDLRWTAGADGDVETLFVTGQMPNYDDVEAVFGRDDVEPNIPYRVSGSASDASEADLSSAETEYPAWVTQRYLSLPGSITPRTGELARALTASASGPYEQARAIEAYLRETIVYDESVSAPPDGADIVDYVLFERQRGYCEYYASAMAVMLRTLGVPSRVAVGFFPGDYDEAQEQYVYLQRNAHAWVEVFFPGYGWIPFEPTSARPTIEQGNVDAGLPSTPPPADEPLATEVIATPDPVTQDVPPPVPPRVTPADDGNGNDWLLPAGVAGLFGALLVAGWALWAVPLRGLSSTSALYKRLTALGRLMGLRHSPSVTPREFGRSLGQSVPQAREHVSRIVHVYEVDQFGPNRADAGMLAEASGAWRNLRRNAWRWLFRRNRE